MYAEELTFTDILISPELSMKMNMMEDKEFIGANQMLKGIKQLMEQRGETDQFEAIEANDLQKMRLHFDRSTPSKLQEVYFSIEYYFSTREREWLRYFREISVIINEYSKGKKYIEVSNIHNIQKISKQIFKSRKGRI